MTNEALKTIEKYERLQTELIKKYDETYKAKQEIIQILTQHLLTVKEQYKEFKQNRDVYLTLISDCEQLYYIKVKPFYYLKLDLINDQIFGLKEYKANLKEILKTGLGMVEFIKNHYNNKLELINIEYLINKFIKEYLI